MYLNFYNKRHNNHQIQNPTNLFQCKPCHYFDVPRGNFQFVNKYSMCTVKLVFPHTNVHESSNNLNTDYRTESLVYSCNFIISLHRTMLFGILSTTVVNFVYMRYDADDDDEVFDFYLVC